MHKKNLTHIAIMTTSFPGGEPGSEAAGSFVEDFAQELSKHVTVTIVAPSKLMRSDEKYDNLTISRFEVPRLPLSLLEPANLLHWPLIFKTLRAGMYALERVTTESRIDHILALWVLPSGYWARRLWKKRGIPYSVWALGSDIWILGKIPLVKNILKGVISDSSICFADGFTLKRDVEKISGKSCEYLASTRTLPTIKRKQVSMIPPYRLAYLGRWHTNKGIDLLIEGLQLLCNDDWKLIKEVRICGGGPLAEMVKLGCDRLHFVNRPLTLMGYLNKKEVAELFLWADYVLLPSRMESIPVVFSDAIQSECPVIAMPVGDIPYLVSKYKVGILSKEVSSKAFSAAIREAMLKPPCTYIDGLVAIKRQFDLSLAVDRFMSFLTEGKR